MFCYPIYHLSVINIPLSTYDTYTIAYFLLQTNIEEHHTYATGPSSRVHMLLVKN